MQKLDVKCKFILNVWHFYHLFIFFKDAHPSGPCLCSHPGGPRLLGSPHKRRVDQERYNRDCEHRSANSGPHSDEGKSSMRGGEEGFCSLP